MSYEDDDDSVGGSLPDPSMRHWRHPSELGQLAAATPSPGPQRFHVGHSVLVFSALALGSVAITTVVLSISGLTMFGQRGLTIPESNDVGVQGSAPIETVLADSSAGDPTEQEPESSAETSSMLALPGPDEGGESDDLQSLTQPSPESVLQLEMNGVFTEQQTGRRVSSFTVLDGLILTSANAIGGRTKIWIRSSGHWVPARVAGIDPYSDVAVLQPEIWLPELDAAEVEVAVDVLNETVKGRTVELAGLPTVSDDVEADLHQHHPGIVISDTESVMAATGFEIYDAIVTTLPIVPHELGAAIMTDDGAVGMVIDTKTSVLAGIPLDTAAEIATSLLSHGIASVAWLGVEAVTGPDSEVRLTAVDDESPAAGLLEEDDVIVSVEGKRLRSADHLVHVVRQAGIDAELDVVVRRGRKMTEVDVRTAHAPNR